MKIFKKNKAWAQKPANKFEPADSSPPANSQSLPLPTKFPERTYQSIDLPTILFLSKRGMSRSPFAQEVMRNLLQNSPYFGRIRVSSRGVNIAYDDCHVDSRMQSYSSKLGLILHGTAKFASIPEIANAALIVTIDADSEDFIKVYKNLVRGQVRSLATFLPPGSEPYFPDPFERGDKIDVDDRYEYITMSINSACEKLFHEIPSLVL